MRIVFIRPCCIGDVVLATAALTALRRLYPKAHITWAIGAWSRQAVAHHPDIDAFLDTGQAALPVKSVGGFVRFVRDLRAGQFDMAVSLVRSPLMSLAVRLSGIPTRVGIDSNGRGFGYTLRLPVDPDSPRHEARIYLDTVALLGARTEDVYANLPVDERTQADIRAILAGRQVKTPFIVVNPAGGSNPGMQLSSKRYPLAGLAQITDAIADKLGAHVVLIGGPDDSDIVNTLRVEMHHMPTTFVGELTFEQIGALAAESTLYIGNDTGLTHISAAVGAPTVMLMGPSDPRRYAPFAPSAIAIWKPTELKTGGVAMAKSSEWDWQRDGIPPDEAIAQITLFLQQRGTL